MLYVARRKLLYTMIGVLGFSCILMGVNFLIYGQWLNLKYVLGITVIFSFYYTVLTVAIGAILTKAVYWKALAISSLFIVVYTLYDVTYRFIYVWLPQIDVFLYQPGIPFSSQQFHGRILNSFLLVGAVSVSVSGIRYKRWRNQKLQQELEEMEQKAQYLQFQLGVYKISPHFFDQILASAMGKTLLRGSGKAGKVMRKLVSVMTYVLYVNKEKGHLVPLKDEWLRVQQLMEIYRWKYGADKVVIAPTKSNDVWGNIMPLSILTLVENAIKYVHTPHEQPIFLRLTQTDECLQFVCSNPFTEEGVRRARSTGFGLSNLEERLEQSDVPFLLERRIEGDIFTIMLTVF